MLRIGLLRAAHCAATLTHLQHVGVVQRGQQAQLIDHRLPARSGRGQGRGAVGMTSVWSARLGFGVRRPRQPAVGQRVTTTAGGMQTRDGARTVQAPPVPKCGSASGRSAAHWTGSPLHSCRWDLWCGISDVREVLPDSEVRWRPLQKAAAAEEVFGSSLPRRSHGRPSSCSQSPYYAETTRHSSAGGQTASPDTPSQPSQQLAKHHAAADARASVCGEQRRAMFPC